VGDIETLRRWAHELSQGGATVTVEVGGVRWTIPHATASLEWESDVEIDEAATARSGLMCYRALPGFTDFSHGSVVADFNGDGRDDIFVNNLNDGMIWGLLPIVLLSLHFSQSSLGLLTAIYPTVWGIGQLFTGRMADRYSKKKLLFWGMLSQGLAILLLPFANDWLAVAAISAALGWGTALVYPTFLSTIAQATPPKQRAESLGVFRLWRDLGYAIGAILSGITADLLGVAYAIFLIGALTLLSSLVIKFRMPSTI
jgi:MFS family permease